MQLIVLDFETYYGADYTLSSMTTEAYVRDPRFEVIGVGLTFPQTGQRAWMEEAQFRRFAAQYDWSQAAVLAHHAHFDGLILSHHYGVRPAYWLDTLSMARAIHGSAASNSLDALMLRYGVGVKGTEVVNAKGKRRVDFTPEEWQRYGAYCLNDCDGAFGVYQKLAPLFPRAELDLIDITVRMFTEPVLVLDEPMLREYLQYETQRKEDLLTRSGIGKKELSSSDKFAELLRGYGVEPPVKLNPKGKTIYAFAKTDPGMQELLEHEDDEVRWLCEARIAVKSTGNQSRTERMLAMGAGGRPLPVYIKYGGAHTLRWSGADKCLVGDTEITVLRAGKILCIMLSQLLDTDLVWDGEEFVHHDGLVYQGEKEVITYGGITGTEDHRVYCTHSGVPVALGTARESNYVIETAGSPPRGLEAAAQVVPGRKG